MVRLTSVEDDELYIRQLKDYLEQYRREKGEEFQITVCRDGDEILKDYRANTDIILMDIQMKFVDGMTAAEEIRKIRSEERRVGKECGCVCRSRWSPDH